MVNETGIASIAKKQSGKSKRVSSYDTTGGNKDYFTLNAGQRLDFCKIEAAGCIKHIWITMAPQGDDDVIEFLPRKVVLSMYWDKEETPSVEAPIGDFFGLGHGITKNFSCAPFTMSPEDGKAFNCNFPMPFLEEARLVVENQSEKNIRFYFYVDYSERTVAPDELRFHAQWRRENPTNGIDERSVSNEHFEFGGKNKDGKNNYVILEAFGSGHYVGCNYNIHNLRQTRDWNWYGEGDDMIFIDGEEWPPTIHGTGTEDYFNTSWCPTQQQSTLYHGILLGGGPNWSGKSTYYRYHILDPITFEKSIKVTIEHGHNNHRSDDISTTAYWYQTEPHKKFSPLPPMKERLPLDDTIKFNEENMRECLNLESDTPAIPQVSWSDDRRSAWACRIPRWSSASDRHTIHACPFSSSRTRLAHAAIGKDSALAPAIAFSRYKCRRDRTQLPRMPFESSGPPYPRGTHRSTRRSPCTLPCSGTKRAGNHRMQHRPYCRF